MTNVTVNSNNVVTNYDKELFKEYVRGSGFKPFMGTSTSMPICVKEEPGGKKISIPFIHKVTGDGVTGSATLRGNGVQIGNYAQVLTPTYRRQAVEFDKEELDKPNFDMRAYAKPALMNWGMENIRDRIVKALCAVHNGTSYYLWEDASAAQRNSWAVANTDRILYGSATTNNSGVVATDLAKVDSSADTLSRNVIGIAKRIAQESTTPKITPFRVKDAVYESYVMFVGTRAYRDLYNSTTLIGNMENALERAKSNPLWMPGDLMVDNVLVREIPEITTLLTSSSDFATAGNGSIPVEPCFLTGAGALAYALSQRPRTIEDNTHDYGHQPGVAVSMKDDIQKLFNNGIQNGMVTVFVSGVAD